MDIKGFQRSKGLVADGVIGKITIKAMKQHYNWSNEEVAHFLGQTHIESKGFRETVEGMNYSAQRMAEVWPSRYAIDPKARNKVPNQTAKRLERNPEALANNVYANRMGNGDESSGDGWKHRGMGYIQLTGKSTQERFADYIGDSSIKETPSKIASLYPLESAIFYFKEHNLFNNLDKADYATIKKLTKAINGGYTHLEERKEQTERYYRMAIQS